MALISINGVALPAPSELQVGIMDISKAERNARGLMIIERVATKRKLFITYNFLTSWDAGVVLKAIAPAYYNVSYFDPQERKMKSGSFYCGDRQIDILDYYDDVPRYKELSFDLIER